MKKKDWQQFMKKPLPELQKRVKEDKDKLWQLKVDLAAGKVKNVKQIRALRKVIAQAETLITQHGKENS